MQYRAVVDMVIPRAMRMGLVDAETGQVDAVEVEMALLRYIQWLVAKYDLDAFTTLNEEIATTSTGRRDYPLPEDFGRLMQPDDRDEHGLFVHDGTNLHRLRYRDPQEWLRLQTSTNNRPTYFTIIGRDLQLDPPPDANNSNHYTLRGTYIQDVNDFSLDDELPVPLAAATEGTLDRLANPEPVTEVMASVVHAQRRTRQPFQRRAQWSRNRGIRR